MSVPLHGPDDPVVAYLGDPAAATPEYGQLELACRFYGFRLTTANDAATVPILVVIPAAELTQATPERLAALRANAEGHRAPIAVIGITAACTSERLAPFFDDASVAVVDAGPASRMWFTAKTPAETGYELRGLGFAVGPQTTTRLNPPTDAAVRTLVTAGPTEAESRPALLRLERDATRRYLLVRCTAAEGAENQNTRFGRTRRDETLPHFVLLRDVGGARCWHAPAAVANLTIDDPWLTEPYGCLSYPGLLAEMQRERFHATIGHVPWNYDRYSPAVVQLFRENPQYFSLAVHGNNHDRYEFYRYEAQPGDNQRPKPLAEQAFNVRQAMARMEAFERSANLTFDRVMVFPHGICPAATLRELKRRGYWATYNYNSTPLGEKPSADPVVTMRTINADWYGFPAVRRAYPEKYPEDMIAIDLFLGNPVMFMAHQDNFFGGIDAFNPSVRVVNARQPAVQWRSLGEISRRLHLLRWTAPFRCEVRLHARHALIANPHAQTAEYQFFKYEPAPETVARVTVEGREVPWTSVGDTLHFAATLPARATTVAEVHYRPVVDAAPVTLRRSGLRKRALRLIADIRDLHLSGSGAGRSLTTKYYGGGKKRLTFGGLVGRIISPFRRRRPPSK